MALGTVEDAEQRDTFSLHMYAPPMLAIIITKSFGTAKRRKNGAEMNLVQLAGWDERGTKSQALR